MSCIGLMASEQLSRLLAVLRSPDSQRSVCQIALFLLSTGAWLNEALSAKWADFSRATKVWRRPASVSKSRKVRVVPLNDSVLYVLAQLDTEGEFENLFINRQTGKPYTTIMKVWSRLRAKAGLPHFRIHNLRHQYASFLVNAGFSLYCVHQILGHADSASSARYSHLSTKSLQDAANNASIMIRGAMPITVAIDLPLLVDLTTDKRAAAKIGRSSENRGGGRCGLDPALGRSGLLSGRLSVGHGNPLPEARRGALGRFLGSGRCQSGVRHRNEPFPYINDVLFFHTTGKGDNFSNVTCHCLAQRFLAQVKSWK